MYSVGDKVVHFTHGAGVITEEKVMEVVAEPEDYLVIQMLRLDSTLMVPSEGADERLRPACEKIELGRLLADELANKPAKLPKNYKKRTKHVEKMLKTGETVEWIKVVRDMTHRDEQKPLSTGDRKLLDRATELLAGELALAHGISLEEAVVHLQSMVRRREELVEQEVSSPDADWWQAFSRRIAQSFVKSSSQAEAGVG
jgi:CarD family transcriptional regulator